MPNCGFREGTHRNRRVTHSANKRSGERETGCALGMCVHGLRFGSLALRLSREIPVKSLFWQKKMMCLINCLVVYKGVFQAQVKRYVPAGLAVTSDACSPVARQTGVRKKMKVKELLFPL